MANMSPDQMAQMAEMAANLDPSMLPKGMPKPSRDQMRQAQEQMKNMRPEELKASLNQATSSMESSVDYNLSTANRIKEEGNQLFRSGSYAEAVIKYSEAAAELDKIVLTSRSVTDARISLMSNIAFSHLKLSEWSECEAAASAVLELDPLNVKALFRRGAARRHLGKSREARADLEKAIALSPSDEAIQKELSELPAVEDVEVIEELEIPARVPSQAPTDAMEAARLLKENPNILSSVTEMMAGMSTDQMKGFMQMGGMPSVGDEELKGMLDMMKNKDMMKSMENLMRNMDPEQLGGLAAGRMGSASAPAHTASEPSAAPDVQLPSASALLSNPEAIKSVESMMDKLPDSVLESMLNSQEQKLPAMVTAGRLKFVVRVLLKLLRLWLFIKGIFAALMTKRGLIIMAIALIFVAVVYELLK